MDTNYYNLLVCIYILYIHVHLFNLPHHLASPPRPKFNVLLLFSSMSLLLRSIDYAPVFQLVQPVTVQQLLNAPVQNTGIVLLLERSERGVHQYLLLGRDFQFHITLESSQKEWSEYLEYIEKQQDKKTT